MTIVETHGQEGEASLRHTTASRDSGVRSVQSSPAYYHYGSTGESKTSIQNCSKDNDDGSVEDEDHKERHSTKSYKKADNSRPEADNTRKTS